MKLTTLILLTACLSASATGHSQTVTLDLKKAPIEKVFDEVSKQTGFSFMYGESLFKGFSPVTIKVRGATINQVLERCFSGQPFTYSVEGSTIVIKKKETNVPGHSGLDPESFSQLPPPIDIHGRIVNEKGEPVIASVQVKGTNKGTTTNDNGEFELKGVNDDATLVISGVSIETFEMTVNGRSDLVLNAKVRVESLNEVVINKGYYTESRKLSVSSVGKVDAKQIEMQPVSNPLLALQGRVPGLIVVQSNGLSGGAVNVQIRGKNSIQNGNDPFYVVDGVPYTSQLLPNLNIILGSTTTGNRNVVSGSGSPLDYISPSDIESIEILKDADATAIYGSRAANGAILITTKKGKAGRTAVNITVQNGWGQVPRHMDLLNNEQYLQMRHEAKRNDGFPVSAFDYDLNGVWDTTRYTDWQKALIGKTSQYTDAQVTVSGGTNATQYLIGCNYHRETQVFPGDFADQKGSAHFSINSNSLNNKFHIQLGGSYLVDDNKLPLMDLTQFALSLAPVAPSLYNADGSLNWSLPNPNVFSSGSWTNPLAFLNLGFQGTTYNLISNSVVSYQILPGLYLKSNLGYTNMQVNETALYPSTASDPYLVSLIGNSVRRASYAKNSTNSWIIEPQLVYTKNLRRGDLNVLLGSTIEQNHGNGQTINGTGYNSDLVLKDVTSAASTTIHAFQSDYKYNAVFGRLSYNWNDQLLFNLNGRRDGSSRFGPKNRFHNFWSVGSGWLFSNENFIKNNLRFLSFGKLRGNYGTSGNDQIANYQFLDLYGSTDIGMPYQGANGLIIENLYNPYVQWEETKKLEVGLDFGFVNDRIMISSSYYRNRSSNQLLAEPIASITGFSSITANLPATVQNSGLEFVFTTTNFKSKSLTWISSMNLTLPHNKLISFNDLENSPYRSIYKIGEPITRTRVFHFTGVDPMIGLYQFADSHGKSVITPNYSTDLSSFIDLAPKFYGGFDNNFIYKGFELDFLFQFTKQTGKNYLFGYLPGRFSGIGSLGNQPKWVLDRWQKPNDIASIQRFASSTGATVNGNSIFNSYNYALSSDLFYSDASFIRLKNLSLSWQLPQPWKSKANLKNCRLFIQGQNLLTFTNYKGLDPETQSTSLPPLRVWTIGINIGL